MQIGVLAGNTAFTDCKWLAKINMSIYTAIMALYMRKRNEGKPTTWGLFSSNGKLPSSVFLRLIHQVSFVTSDSGSSSTWTLHAAGQACPPG